jgi:DNA repair protein RecO
MDVRSTGLLLHSIPYLGNHRILKVLTPDSGLVTLIAKHATSKRANFSALTTPFLLAEWVYHVGRKEIHTLTDGTLLDDFAPLKLDYDRLCAAGQIGQDLLKTQMPSKAAQGPFDLTLACFRKLPLFSHPANLIASFQLRLLSHEGMLHLEEGCTQCSEPMSHLYGGESFCSRHAPPASLSFTSTEQLLFKPLFFSRSFAELAQLPLDPNLCKKIGQLFEERTRH